MIGSAPLTAWQRAGLAAFVLLFVAFAVPVEMRWAS